MSGTTDRLRGLSAALPERGTWTDTWRDKAYAGRGMPVQAAHDHLASAPTAGLRAGDVGLAFRLWYGHGTAFARVAVLSGPLTGQVVDTEADGWIDASPEAVAAVQS